MAAKPFPSGHILAAADVNDLTGILDRSTSTVDVVNTVTKTTIYSKVIAAGAMSSDRWLRLRVIADYLNDTGSAKTVTVRLAWGTSESTLFSESVAAVAGRYAASFEVEIMNAGATNSQIIVARRPTFASTAVAVLELPPFAQGEVTTADITLAVNVEHSAAHASLSFRKRGAVLELL